jgi:hypothetical protein
MGRLQETSFTQICFLTDTVQPLLVLIDSLQFPPFPRTPSPSSKCLPLPRSPTSIAPSSSSRVCLIVHFAHGHVDTHGSVLRSCGSSLPIHIHPDPETPDLYLLRVEVGYTTLMRCRCICRG